MFLCSTARRESMFPRSSGLIKLFSTIATYRLLTAVEYFIMADNAWGDDSTLDSIVSLGNEQFNEEEDLVSVIGNNDVWDRTIDEHYEVEDPEVMAISEGTRLAIGNISASEIVHLGENSCPLSDYLSSTSQKGYHSTGYVGESAYVVPLHFLSVVPGHKISRLALRQTETTTDAVRVSVNCTLSKMLKGHGVGSLLLSESLKTITNCMDANQFCPSNFAVECVYDETNYCEHTPLALGNSVSSQVLSAVSVKCSHEGCYWTVPTTPRPRTTTIQTESG
jgi:hypothetical protein